MLLVWDVTCTDTFAPSFLASAASEAGAVAALAEKRKKAKYQNLDALHMFVPFAVETTEFLGHLHVTSEKTLVTEYFWPQESDCLAIISHSVCL